MYAANQSRELTDRDDADAYADAQRLADHLLRDHGRLPHEIAGLPLDAIHDLEHFDESLGLLHLRHRHQA